MNVPAQESRPRPRWAPDAGWTGDWVLPPLLLQPLSPPERAALIALSCGGVGPAGLARALTEAESVTEALAAHPQAPSPQQAMERVERTGARVLIPADPEYPRLLHEIAAPPPLLYVLGEPLEHLQPAVAVVGSRACTPGAARFTRRLAEAFARAGFTVVSGLARGIDRAAHEGALDAGRSVAVLGAGIDRIYPTEHKGLASRLERTGALITEFPPGVTPRPWHFVARNRLISGLSIAVVVVEAAKGSGALITGGFGIQQGREVYACITGPDNPAGSGVREMLREGAPAIVHEVDAAVDLVLLAQAQGYELAPVASSDGTEPRLPLHLDGDAARVYEAVLDGTTADEVAKATGLRPASVAIALAELELDGVVAEDGTGRWRRTTP